MESYVENAKVFFCGRRFCGKIERFGGNNKKYSLEKLILLCIYVEIKT